jgi:AAHS family benzoate transporter-like MFS transporter
MSDKPLKLMEKNRLKEGIAIHHKVSIPSLTVLVVIFCFLSMLADGYDLGIYGAVLPKLLEDKQWALSPVQAGAIGSYALLGMLFGAIMVGTITDLIGRKWTLIFSLTVFSITMGLAAMAQTPETFGFIRFVGGIGLGGVIPTASALTIEYSPVQRRSFIYAVMFTGYSFGIVLGAVLSILLLQNHGWRFLFWIGILPILLVPFIILYLPESVNFLLARNRKEEAEKICERYHLNIKAIEMEEGQRDPKNKWQGLSTLFSRKYIRATLLLWVTYCMSMFLIYGLNTWLPQMMKKAGYPLGSSLSFMLTLNLTAAVGTLIAGLAADRWGSQRLIGFSYLLAAICIALLSVKSSIFVVYVLVGLAGFGSVGNTQLLNAYVTKYFSSHSRATALGWGLGVGRIGAISGPIIIGLLMSKGMNQMFSFYTFAIAGLLASLSILLVPKKDNEMI